MVIDFNIVNRKFQINVIQGETPQPPTEGCGSPNWVGDNYCDDENNNEDCEWDGGDCCGNVNETYCFVSIEYSERYFKIFKIDFK